ncbi:MAG: ribonuclease III [Patescibacteria group bacterium]
MDTLPLTQFQEAIGIQFNDSDVLERAFTHRSYLNEQIENESRHNERLEFLGDAVLELVITDFLYQKFPREKEGVLTAYRAALVNTDSLAMSARALEMDEYLRMSKGERMDTQKGRQHILANTFEAFVGALYVDQGYGQARDFIASQLFPKIDTIIKNKLFRDPKSYFQEQAQDRQRITPHYALVDEEGPDHDKEFVMAAYLENEEIARGKGPSKQKAETNAAQNALEALGWD